MTTRVRLRGSETVSRAPSASAVALVVALGGSLGYYGGEDMDEKSSMMAHSDVLVTVYSTMVVETAVHDTPIVAAVIGVLKIAAAQEIGRVAEQPRPHRVALASD